MSIAYRHQRSPAENNSKRHTPAGTIVINLNFNKQLLERCFISHSTALLIPIGITVLHYKDRFVKSIGRNLALSKVMSIPCILEEVKVENLKHLYKFTCKKDMLNITFILSTIAETEKVHLINAWFTNANT